MRFVNDGGKMSILKFFKPLVTHRPIKYCWILSSCMLTKVISSSAINMVKDEVSKVYESISNKRGKYLTLTPAQQFEVCKRAAEHGIPFAALACFDNKLRIVWISQLPIALQFLSCSISTYTHGSL